MANEFDLDEGFEEVNLDEGFEEVPVDLDEGFEDVSSPEDLMQKGREAQADFAAPQAEEFQPDVTPLEPGQMGKLEAAAISAAPSMTFGASDVLAGVSGATGHAVGDVMEGNIPKYEELLDTYYEAKKGEGQRREKAMEDQPAASVAGMIGGGFLIPGAGTAKVLSKAGKIGKLASKVLPNTKSFSEAARLKKRASTIKDVKELYSHYKMLKKAAVAKTAMAGITEGTKAGAIMGATMGEAELLKGELAKTAKEAVEGAASGATYGGILSGGLALSGAAMEAFPGVKNVLKAFKTGKEGHELSKEYIQGNTRKLVKGFLKDMNKKFAKLGATRDEIVAYAKKLGKMVKTEDDVADAINHLEQFEGQAFARKAEDYVDTLKAHLGSSKNMRKVEEAMIKKQTQMNQMDLGLDEVASRKLAKDQMNSVLKTQQKPVSVKEGNIKAKDITGTEFDDITTKVQQRTMESGKTKMVPTDVTPKVGQMRKGIDPKTGMEYGAIKDVGTGKEAIRVAGKPLPGLQEGQATLDQAINLKKQIQDYTYLKAGENVPEEVKKSATGLIKKLTERIDDAVADGAEVNVSDINKKFNKLYNTFEAAGVSEKAVGSVNKYKQLQDMAKFITDAGDDKTYQNIELFIKELTEGAPDIAAKYGDEISKMRELVELSAGTEYIPLGANKLMTTLMGTIGGAINRVANLAGRSASNISKGGRTGHLTRRFIESKPEKTQKLIEKVRASGKEAYQQYLGPLEKALTEQGRTRSAIMFGLMQRPDFRQMIELFDDEKED